ncbi:hypothetical protein L218DRAFT_1076007 [Marasmius fiardii PR-910]|nr:hypothetical protein L218DRAFT_1076007 [Marasmius fiardii PR-910]
MPSSSTGQAAPPTWTEPPWCGWIETTGDALLILEAARRGLIPRVTRRLVDSERKMISSGSVFVFDEDESGIKRWTDGFFWSPSRILGNFLLYRETDKKSNNRGVKANGSGGDSSDVGEEGTSLSRPKDGSQLGIERQRERNLMGSLTNNPKFKSDGLMKKTFSLTIGGVAQHLISYYRVEDVENGRLRSPSSLPELASLSISPEYLDKTHFRNPPKVEIGPDGIPHYRGEADDVEVGLGISRPKPPPPLTVGPPLLSEGVVRGAGSASATASNHRFEPYAGHRRPRRQKSVAEGDTTPSPIAATPAQALATTPPTPIVDPAQISAITPPPSSAQSPTRSPPSLYPESQTQSQTQTPPHFHYTYYTPGQTYPYPPVYAYHHPSATSTASPQPKSSSPNPHSAASASSSSNSATSPVTGGYSHGSGSPSVVPYPYDPNAAGAQQQQPVYYSYGFGYPTWSAAPPYGYPVQQSTSGSGTEKPSNDGDGGQAPT